MRVASAQVDELEGTRERRRASLLPHVNGDALANRQNIDLAALGISFPQVPMVVGPFGHYDFRLSANQSLIDRHSYHNWKASERQEEAAKLDYQDARDLVIRQAAGLYLNSQASAAEVEAAESRVTTSETLEKLARDQHAQGLATAVDEPKSARKRGSGGGGAVFWPQLGRGVGLSKEDRDAGRAREAKCGSVGRRRGEGDFWGGVKGNLREPFARTGGGERAQRFFRRPSIR